MKDFEEKPHNISEKPFNPADYPDPASFSNDLLLALPVAALFFGLFVGWMVWG